MTTAYIDPSEIGRKGGLSRSPAKRQASALNGTLGGRPIKATLNEDGRSVNGCSHIYAPRGQAGEYAPLATNPFRGCGHGCAYCYVPRVTKQDRLEFNAGAVVRPNFLSMVERDAKKYQALGITEQVMLSFTTDPYPLGAETDPETERDPSYVTRETIKILRDYGLGFCTLTKAGTKALRDMDLFRPDRDAFSCSLTSLDAKFSRKWEPNAALPEDRIAALKQFHDAGIFTWASLEPTLDVDASIEIIEETHEFVDLYKIGRVNYLPMTKTTDWEDYTHRILDVVNRLGVAHYIKKDLQPYLPAGYWNPLRRQQHH